MNAAEELSEGGSPLCPNCGRPMVLRTARKGRNAGGQFYGCSQYPDCKATLSLEEAAKLDDGRTLGPASIPSPRGGGSDTDSTPRPVSVAASSISRQAILFEGTALPRVAAQAVAELSLNSQITRSLCQWKLEVPIKPFTGELPEATWLVVAEKILKRGKVIPLSPSLERKLASLVGGVSTVEAEEWVEAVTSVALLDRRARDQQAGFDSQEERDFYERIVPSFGGDQLQGWLSRQVLLGGLTGSEVQLAASQRVDFLFAHPRGPHVVIEIDGAQHADEAELDASRDVSLRARGLEILRIPAAEVRAGHGAKIEQLGRLFSGVTPSGPRPATSLGLLVLLGKRAFQIQMSLVQAILTGLIPDRGTSLRVCLRLDDLLEPAAADIFTKEVLGDLNEMIRDLVSLWQEPDKVILFRASDEREADIILAFDHGPVSRDEAALLIQDLYLPVSVASYVMARAPASAASIDRATAERLLTRIFGFEAFREGQFEAVARCLRGQDTILLLPTGAGKSVAYQLAGLLRPGVCIVIDPIIALMEDQMANLRVFGVDRTAQISSALDPMARSVTMDLLARGEYLFCFVAPERFQDQTFRDSLAILTRKTPVSLIVVDEAHCVSEWGHDFRPAYLNIAHTARGCCGSNSVSPPLMALTGTASRAVLKDIQRELQVEDFEAIITPRSFDRPELRFVRIRCRSSEKHVLLRGHLEALPSWFGCMPAALFQAVGPRTMSGLVFCPHVDGDYGVVRASEEIARQLGLTVPLYSGGAPGGFDKGAWDQQKRKTASDFKRNRFPLLTCTKAFGMGIDKPNIRYTVHYCLPPSIESFYQEAGRAGRDQQLAICAVLYSNDRPERTRLLLDPSTSVETILERIDSLERNEGDDITRSLFFHTRAFHGARQDYDRMVAAIDEMRDIEHPGHAALSFSLPRGKAEERDELKRQKEHAIHRLLTLGVISDYTVDYRRSMFFVEVAAPPKEDIVEHLYRYIAAYQREQARMAVARLRESLDRDYVDFVGVAGQQLITFIYEIIERSRRRALSEMLQACEECKEDAAFRERILDHFGKAFSRAIEAVIEGTEAGLRTAVETLEDVSGALDAGHLRGESGRALEAYPDHPGLLLLRGVSEAMTTEPDETTIRENVRASAAFAMGKYGVDEETVLGVILSAARMVGDQRPHLGRIVLSGLLHAVEDKRLAARRIIEELPVTLAVEAVGVLVSGARAKLAPLLEG